MIRHVVDANVAIKWFVEEVHADQARRLQDDEYELLAPGLLWPESGNILWKKVQRGELTAEEARLIRQGLEKQPIHTFPSSLVLEPALEIALDTLDRLRRLLSRAGDAPRMLACHCRSAAL